jgi:DNA-binding PadR family transcriptional regulator
MKRAIEDNLILSESAYYILLCLAAEARHGYAIIKEVEALSRGKLRLSTGTLYGVLKRLLEQGWIVPQDIPDDEPATPGKPRRVYRLTEQGRTMLAAEIQRLERLASLGRSVAAL